MIVTYPSPIARKTLDSEIKRGQSRHHAMGENFLDERFCGGGTSDGSRRRSPTPEPPPEREIIRPTLLRDFAVGLRAGFGHRLVRPILLVEGNVAFFDGFFFALYLIFTIDTLGLSPGVVGVLIGMGGIGALMGALIARRVPSFLGLRLAMIRLTGLAQAAQLLIPLAHSPDWMVPSLLATHQLIGDAMMVAYVVLAVSLRQSVSPLGVLRRANATPARPNRPPAASGRFHRGRACDSARCPDGDLDRRAGWPVCAHDPRFIADPDVATDAGTWLNFGVARRRPPRYRAPYRMAH